MGLKGLQKETASGREKALAAACEARGGKADAIYYVIGQDDTLVIVDLPSHAHAASVTVAAGATGMFSNWEVVPLLTVAEMDQGLADTTAYRPPGG